MLLSIGEKYNKHTHLFLLGLRVVILLGKFHKTKNSLVTLQNRIKIKMIFHI